MRLLAAAICVLAVATAAGPASAQATADKAAGQAKPSAPAPSGHAAVRAALDRYCVTCHNERLKTAGLTLDTVDLSRLGDHVDVLEKVLRKVQMGAMPPINAPQPDGAAMQVLTAGLEAALDRAATPNPGQIPAMRRLTRTEYGNAIRDLLGLKDLPEKMNIRSLLPEDNSGSGFDNIAELLFVSPTAMEQYLKAATKISHLAIGDLDHPIITGDRVGSTTGRPQDFQNDDFAAGTRGGTVTNTYLPVDGEYLFTITIGGPLIAPEKLEVSLDDQVVRIFEQTGPWTQPWWINGYGNPRQRFDLRLPIKAGPHKIAVTFVQPPLGLTEQVVQKRERPGGRFEKILTGERQRPAVLSVTVTQASGAVLPSSTPARDRIFVCRLGGNVTEIACARTIFLALARRAYRRPVTPSDVEELLPFYETGRAAGGFDEGIKRGLERLLVSPQFLFRIEAPPGGTAPGAAYRVSNLDLATRLSFFLWSSIPDDTLLSVAEKGQLKNPIVLKQQVQRMLADPRAKSLVSNFAEQWLYLRDIDSKIMDDERFPNFDEGLRLALRRETELFVTSVLLENRSVLDLLRANYTFLNERLARHYGIPNVRGNDFRRVTFGPNDPRGGLLGQGSVLMLTSYGTRTSPVIRGKWILENLLAAPPPPPPADVPGLTEKNDDGRVLSMREAMEKHRSNPVCAGCHAKMDPLGFALENFDAVGAWQTRAADGSVIDVTGAMPDGTKFEGLPGLRRVLAEVQGKAFVVAFTEKLLKYALGRDLTARDAPLVRKIVRDAASDEYAFYALVRGVVASLPFQARMAPR